ncbi:MAG: flippase-like domain-containing protein [Bacteroidaceae bacterium]|nr:flippase-like domain-containing protein [Bacteroidaceae bacterium]MBR2862756.1 flippase-like domain-containing protein [Bacteroidaceae bacterium]
MKPLYRNIFMLFGVAAIIVMLCTFEDGYEQIKDNILRAGLYLPAVIGVWIFVYACNALAFQIIVNSGKHDKHLDFRHAYKLTISGFAFSYTTPFGFGGGPYRVMELAGHIGTPRAMSSVVLYSMMHILSHFCLWTTSVFIFIFFYTEMMTPALWSVFGIYLSIFVGALYIFNYGYKNGLIVKLYSILLKIPYAKKPARKFYDKHLEAMQQVDRNISYLREQRKAFWSSLFYEYLGRIINSLEYFFILIAFGLDISFADAVLVLAFSSLMGNLLFFFPMQLGAREGGLALIIKLLGIGTGGVGVFTSFYTRIRELVWIFIGVGLVKVGNKKIMK